MMCDEKLSVDKTTSQRRNVVRGLKHTPIWTEDKAYDLEFAQEIIRETRVIDAAILHMLKFTKAHGYVWDNPECIPQLKAQIALLRKERKHLVWYDEKKIRSVFKECGTTLIKYRNFTKDILRLSRLEKKTNEN